MCWSVVNLGFGGPMPGLKWGPSDDDILPSQP